MDKIGKKIALAIFLSMSLLFAVFLPGIREVKAEDVAVVYVDPPISHVAVGTVFYVNVSIANVTNLYCYEIELYYNTTVLDGIEGVFPPGHILEPEHPIVDDPYVSIDDKYNATHGRVFACFTLLFPEEPRNGSGTMFTITFNATAPGSSVLDLYNTKLGEYLPPDIPYITPIPHETLDGTVQVKIPGDANGDGVVNVIDLGMLGGAWGSKAGDLHYDVRVDFNGDGRVNIIDLGILGGHWGWREK